MNRPLAFVAAAIVAVAWLPLTVPAAHAYETEIPEDCFVPPERMPEGINVIIGTDDPETLVGTPGPDFICGRLGDDRIFGLGGNDMIASDTTTFFGSFDAEGGDDLVFGGTGKDEILPGPGDDRVLGGRGGDFIALALGDDVGIGGRGRDMIIGGFGRDETFGGRGDDIVAGGPDNDLVHGGLGDDQLFGGVTEEGPPPGVDVCIGRAGTDTAKDCDTTRGVEILAPADAL